MLSISHATTGAFVASKFPNPVIYIPLAMALHFLGDYIPHWDVGEGMCEGRRTKKEAFWGEIIDLALTAAILWWFWLSQYPLIDLVTFKEPMAWHILLGALAGLIPDLIEAPRIFFGIELKIFGPINRFHERFHQTTSNKILGLLPQVMVLLLIFWLK